MIEKANPNSDGTIDPKSEESYTRRMSTLTIQIEDASLLEKATKVAREQKTSVTRYLSSLAEPSPSADSEEQRRKMLAAELEQTISAYSRDWGGRGYASRDELHER